MRLISQKKKETNSTTTSTYKNARVTTTDMPPTLETKTVNRKSSNISSLPLRNSLPPNKRCTAPTPQRNTPPINKFMFPTKEVRTQSNSTFQRSNVSIGTAPKRKIIGDTTHPNSSSGAFSPPSNNNHGQKDNDEALSDEANDFISSPRTTSEVPTRGPCKQIKTSRMVRTTRQRLKVVYNGVTRRATSAEIHSLLVHDIGAIVRTHCPMDTGYWSTISSNTMTDLIDEITTNFDVDLQDKEMKGYISRLYAGRYIEFKAELSKYFKSCKTLEKALETPPRGMQDRDADEWTKLCDHFSSEKFMKSSVANTSNRSKKKHNHRTGSRPIAYIVEEMAAGGSKFPEVDTFEYTYTGKDKSWKSDEAKAQHDEMLEKTDEYLLGVIREQQLPEDTPLEEVPVDNPDAGLDIMVSVLGVKPGRRIRGCGDGRLRDTNLKQKHMENELAVERAARKAADMARLETEKRLQKKIKVMGKQFNSTLEAWHTSLQQSYSNVPGFILPPFTALPVDIDDEVEDEPYDLD
ncbi:unnamed protein product [Cuscuta epithymum]|uniref:Transposase, Ptta/En/Spm, plant n=1 Tax=Cuscuta epithymum TaxID=186058 RepID=A0AAV0C0N2_9ASTE|nr:unnamed protein product [Cuscuta epithymum]